MKRFLFTIAALAVFATSSVPASALNPQPLPPKVFKSFEWTAKKKQKPKYASKYNLVRK